MKNKLTLFALIVVLTLAVLSMASSAEEQGLPAGKPGGPPYFSNQKESPMNEYRGMMNLGLSDEQSTEIKTIMFDFQKESLEIKNQIQIMHLEFQELLLESAVDMENVRAKLEEIANLEVELKVKAIENQSKIKAVLTEEQSEKLSLG